MTLDAARAFAATFGAVALRAFTATVSAKSSSKGQVLPTQGASDSGAGAPVRWYAEASLYNLKSCFGSSQAPGILLLPLLPHLKSFLFFLSEQQQCSCGGRSSSHHICSFCSAFSVLTRLVALASSTLFFSILTGSLATACAWKTATVESLEESRRASCPSWERSTRSSSGSHDRLNASNHAWSNTPHECDDESSKGVQTLVQRRYTMTTA